MTFEGNVASGYSWNPKSLINELATLDPKDDLLGVQLLCAHHAGPELKDYIDWLVENDGELMIGLDGIDLGFITDYFWLSKYFRPLRFTFGFNHEPRHILVDVGCCTAVQQVFFKHFDEYIGIDYQAHYQRNLHGNARFIQGEFADLVESGEFVITDEMVGVANMSILYDPNRERNATVFNRFKKKAIR